MSEQNGAYTRAILNANKGIANVIDHDIIVKDLQAVADRMFNILKDHYGPYSGFAAMDSNDPLQETVFTKDGIGIIRHIEFASPQEDWMRKTIAYIGTKIESAVGDGTTSAMMFTCAMLKRMLQTVDQIRPVSYKRLHSEFLEFISSAKRYEESERFLPADEEKDPQQRDSDVRRIVYNQVYTASHGNVELADCISKVFVSCPKELWGSMQYECCKYENDRPIEVIDAEGQYQMECDVMAKAMLNKDLSSWYENKSCRLFVMNDAIRVSDAATYQRLKDAMNQSGPDSPVVILCHRTMDGETYSDLNTFLETNAKNGGKVAIFYSTPKNPNVNDYRALQLLCGIDVTSEKKMRECFEVDNVYVKFKNKELTLDNIYPVPEEYKNSRLRHFCFDGVHMQFTDYLEGLKKYTESLNKADKTYLDADEVNFANRLYAKLRYPGVKRLRIGGNALDNLAMREIVDDCMRASIKALQNGVVFSNNRTLYQFVKNVLADGKTTRLERWFAMNILGALEDIAKAALHRIYPNRKFRKRRENDFVEWWYDHAVDMLSIIPNVDWDDKDRQVQFDIADKIHELIDMGVNVITQPANADISMLERFAEVALKYVLTERIIIKGAAYVKEFKQ